jgi:hypothetical protein
MAVSPGRNDLNFNCTKRALCKHDRHRLLSYLRCAREDTTILADPEGVGERISSPLVKGSRGLVRSESSVDQG